MWSQGRFQRQGHDGDHMHDFADKTLELGFRHVEISYVIPPDGVELLLEHHIGISSVHSPAPRVRMPDGRLSDAYNLASTDEEERRLGVARAQVTVDYAVRAGAGYIVVHLGGIGGEIFGEERQLRRLYDEGQREGEQVDALRRRAAERRREGAPAFLPAAERSLAEIAEHAARNGVAIGLENRYHFHEFPGIDEMPELLGRYPPEVVGFWLDVGHAEVLDRLGFIPHRRWLDEIGDRCIGTHVHDVDGLADHRAPAHGTADWAHYAAKLPPGVPRVFEINQKVPEAQVAAAIPFLRQRGVLPPGD